LLLLLPSSNNTASIEGSFVAVPLAAAVAQGFVAVAAAVAVALRLVAVMETAGDGGGFERAYCRPAADLTFPPPFLFSVTVYPVHQKTSPHCLVPIFSS
jgi:hypothetical protein